MFIILIDVAGTGKTTIGQKLAARLGVPFFEGDKFHSLQNIEKMANGIPLIDADRQEWLITLRELIKNQLKHGESGVLACSALKQSYREILCISSKMVVFIHLKGDYDLIYQRLKARSNHYMTPELLKSQYQDLQEPESVFTINVENPPDVIVEQIIAYLATLKSS